MKRKKIQTTANLVEMCRSGLVLLFLFAHHHIYTTSKALIMRCMVYYKKRIKNKKKEAEYHSMSCSSVRKCDKAWFMGVFLARVSHVILTRLHSWHKWWFCYIFGYFGIETKFERHSILWVCNLANSKLLNCNHKQKC